MKYICRLMLICIALTFAACSDSDKATGPDSTPPADTMFSYKLIVEDPQGQPVPDLRVSAWNNVSYSGLMLGEPGQGNSETMAPNDIIYGHYTLQNGIFSVCNGLELDGLFLIVEGELIPVLLVDHMNMVYNHVDGNTRIFISPPIDIPTITPFTGDVLSGITGNILYIDASAPVGNVVFLTLMPTEYNLHQNYPNPFNTSTTIAFGIPVAGSWTVNIEKLNGDSVESFSGLAEAGIVRVTWDATNVPAGVYSSRLQVSLQADLTIFEDSSLIVVHRPDGESSTLGFTDTSGTWQTDDSLLFPGILGLPAITRTGAMDSELIGTIEFLETVTILLKDTASGAWQQYSASVTNGSNQYHLEWNPPN